MPSTCELTTACGSQPDTSLRPALTRQPPDCFALPTWASDYRVLYSRFCIPTSGFYPPVPTYSAE
jgi:hypothetical protein